MKIDWQPPSLRAGFWGKIDNMIGPGATRAEKNLQLYLPILAALMLIASAHFGQWGWTALQYCIASLLTIDMLGGIITNATSSAKRWFHRSGQAMKQHLSFVAMHAIQLSLFSWAFLDFNGEWILGTSSYLLLACFIILRSPLYLQRPVALSLYALSLILSLYVFRTPPELAWFLPLFYLKLLISHLLKEAPYRPDGE